MSNVEWSCLQVAWLHLNVDKSPTSNNFFMGHQSSQYSLSLYLCDLVHFLYIQLFTFNMVNQSFYAVNLLLLIRSLFTFFHLDFTYCEGRHDPGIGALYQKLQDIQHFALALHNQVKTTVINSQFQSAFYPQSALYQSEV